MKAHRVSMLLGIATFATLTLPLRIDIDAQEQPDPKRTKPSSLERTELGAALNVHACGHLFLAGQFTREDIDVLRKRGVQRVITLRTDGELDWDEKALVENAGLEFVSVPFRQETSLTDDVFARIRALLGMRSQKTLLHCGSANRVGAVWLPYRVLDERVNVAAALEEARKVGLRNAGFEKRALAYIQRARSSRSAVREDKEPVEKSVKPGINTNFLDAELDVQSFVKRFEVESREVYSSRQSILAACGLKPGQRIADVGAGTGLFTRLFSKAVGGQGWVFAVDISPRFVEHIRKTSTAEKISNVTAVLCHENSIDLPPASVDFVFVCDTYHHFEYPQSTLASIRRALKPGGTLFVIEFDRIPGVTREWLLNHVRAGKKVFQAEIEAAGFKLDRELEVDGLNENYALRFTKN